MTREDARALRSAASALEHGRYSTAMKKLNQVVTKWLGEPKVPIVVVEGGIVQEVLNVRGYEVWDWNDFQDAPCDYWDEAGEDFRNTIRTTFSAHALRQIQEALGEDMAYEIELENKRKQTDPFWMVPAYRADSFEEEGDAYVGDDFEEPK